MMIKVAVMFMASNVVEVEVPDGISIEDQREVVRQRFNKDLPEVLEGSDFEFPVSFQIMDDPENEDVDLKS